MNLTPQTPGDWIALSGVVTTCVGTVYALLSKLNDAKRDATESKGAAESAHVLLGEHERRILQLEAGTAARNEVMVAGLARVEGQVSQLAVRFDTFLINIDPNRIGDRRR